MSKPAGRLGQAVEAAASSVTEDQKRRRISQADRLRWGTGRHASGAYGIISSRGEVVAESREERHRDLIIEVVRSETRMTMLVERAIDLLKGGTATQVANFLEDAERALVIRP